MLAIFTLIDRQVFQKKIYPSGNLFKKNAQWVRKVAGNVHRKSRFFSKINAKQTHYNFSIKLLCSGRKEENIALKKKILIYQRKLFQVTVSLKIKHFRISSKLVNK